MTAVWLLLKGIPWQIWAGVAAIVILLGYGQVQYNEGWKDAGAKHETEQQRAKDAAGKEVDRLRGGDRSRVMQFDRD